MRQALHILRKDIRYLWIEIAAVLVAVGLLVLTAAQWPGGWNPPLPRTVASSLMPFLLIFAWWTLITRAVHAEPLVGDRQFWPTRPYSWKSLLASKALLFAIFVNLPVLVAQAVIIRSHGFSPGAEFPGLLWSQLLLTFALILPIAAIAALTASVVQFLVIVLVGFVAEFLLSMRFMLFASAMVGAGWGPIDWMPAYYMLLLIAIAAPAVLIWQYAQRRTALVSAMAVTVLLAIVLGAPFSWTTAFALQSRLSPHSANESALRVGLYSKFQWMTRALIERDGRVAIHVPLQIQALADNLTVEADGLEVAIEGAGGAVWHAPGGWRSNVSADGQLISLQTTVDGLFYRRVKDQPVRLQGYLYATLYGNQQVSKVPFTGRAEPVPGLGICSATAGKGAPYFLTCNSVFRHWPDLLSVQFEDSGRDAARFGPRYATSYSPFPAEFGFDPMIPFSTYSVFRGPLDAVTVTTVEPVSHVRVPLQIDGLRLADYESKL